MRITLRIGVVVGLAVLAACERESGQPASAAGQSVETYQAERAARESSPPDPRRFGVASAPARVEGTIRIATYNVENLFDDVDDPDLSGRFEDIDDEKPAAACEAVAKAILEVDADVIALQEIESEAALTAFLETYLPGAYPHVACVDAGNERGIEQAVLSRFPIEHVENWVRLPLGGVHPEKYGDQENWYAGEDIVFHRSPLRVDVRAGGEVLTLFVVHQKSGRYSGYWREAEASKLVELIEAFVSEHPSRAFAVLGDFNATADQPPLETFFSAGLIDSFAGQSGPEITTHASGRRIDFVLLSEGLSARLEGGFVLGTPARPAGSDWRSTPPPPGYASDHYPAAVDLGRE